MASVDIAVVPSQVAAEVFGGKFTGEFLFPVALFAAFPVSYYPTSALQG